MYSDGDIALEVETVISNRNDEDEDVELCSNKLMGSDGDNMEEASLKDPNLVSDENDNNESGFIPGKKQKIARECSSAGYQSDDEEQEELNRAKFVSRGSFGIISIETLDNITTDNAAPVNLTNKLILSPEESE